MSQLAVGVDSHSLHVFELQLNYFIVVGFYVKKLIYWLSRLCVKIQSKINSCSLFSVSVPQHSCEQSEPKILENVF